MTHNVKLEDGTIGTIESSTIDEIPIVNFIGDTINMIPAGETDLFTGILEEVL